MKLIVLKTLFIIMFSIKYTTSTAQNNIDNLITNSDWNNLFPKRAGTISGHPQGYTSDFFSYTNFKTAIDEMSDYLVEIRKKPGVWGELTTITKKSTNTTYVYNDVESWWHNNPTEEVIINVDFQDFVNRSSNANNKRELAAFLANISKETTGGWQLPVGGGSNGDYAEWGLYFVHEVGYTSANGAGTYSDTSNTDYPPNPSVGYYGRGPIQLSWNYNYGQFSKFLYNDPNILLNNPDLIQQNGVLAFKSAIWFWMMPQCPKPSCHQVMHELWSAEPGDYSQNTMYKKGFAHTNNIINGGLECRTTSSAAFTEKVVLRSELYKYYLDIMGFTTTEIAQEDNGEYSTLCYQNNSVAMEDYSNCQISATLNINSLEKNLLNLSPNPATTNINISNNYKIENIEIYTITGNKIMERKVNRLSTTINLNKLNKGLYMVVIKSQNKLSTHKLIKQ